MKTSNLFLSSMLTIATCLCLSLLFTSCEKEQLSTTENTIPEQFAQSRSDKEGDGDIDPTEALAVLKEIPFEQIRLNEKLEMLHFETPEVAKQTQDLLEKANEVYQEEISSSIEGLKEDVIAEMDIDGQLIVETFEDKLGFVSMRKAAEEKMLDLLNRGGEDVKEESLQALRWGPPTVMAAMLNPKGEYMMARHINVTSPSGGQYTIIDGNVETLKYLETNPVHEEIVKLKNVLVVLAPAISAYSCSPAANKYAVKFRSINGNLYAAIIRVSVVNNNNPTHRAYGSLFSFRRVGSNWLPNYTFSCIRLKGSVYESTYSYFTCTYLRYNPITHQFEWVTGLCKREHPCRGNRLAVNKTRCAWTYFNSTYQDFPNKISASNLNGPAHILNADYYWMGAFYNLAVL